MKPRCTALSLLYSRDTVPLKMKVFYRARRRGGLRDHGDGVCGEHGGGQDRRDGAGCHCQAQDIIPLLPYMDQRHQTIHVVSTGV
jgi:hypothetical protein